MTPSEIRALRGALSRPALARLLGVSPLTVLRWELPEGSKEARRPRARMVEALQRLAADGRLGSASGASHDADGEEEDADEASEPVSPPGPEAVAFTADEAVLAPILDRLATEGWERAEDELLTALSTGTLGSRAGRASATIGLAQARLLGRFDVRGALATIAPIVDEAERGRLPRAVAARAHVIAALVFSAPHSRELDAGRANVHAARAEELLDATAVDLRAFVAAARVAAAQPSGTPVFVRSYVANKAHLDRAASPFARFLAAEMRRRAARVAGDHAASVTHGDVARELAERLRNDAVLVALTADHAWETLFAARTPDVAREIVSQARARAKAAGLPLSDARVRMIAVEIEVLCREGRVAEAGAVLEDGLATAKRAGVPHHVLVVAATHVYMMGARVAELEALAAAMDEEPPGPSRAVAALYARYIRGVTVGFAGDQSKVVEAMNDVCSLPDGTPGLDLIVHDAHYEMTRAAVGTRDRAQSRAAFRRFESLLESRPSAMHTGFLRRLEGVASLLEGRVAEARQKLESAIAVFGVIGATPQVVATKFLLALVAQSAGMPGAEAEVAQARRELEGFGVALNPLMERVFSSSARPSDWNAQTTTERLVVAAERLGLRGMLPESFRGELAATLRDLFPGSQIVVSADAEARDGEDTVELGAPGGEQLRAGVRGALDPEQRAALRILAMLLDGRARPAAARPLADTHDDDVLPGFLAAAAATRALKREIAQLSQSNATILVTGESGVGKEVVAKAVHDLSKRAGRPYVAFNCASVPRELFEGQLFGYRKGAFTGATSDSPGIIRAADGGTLFLDEIGELPLDTQPKLLRFLENGEVFPLGEQRPRRVDVRVVAATHRDLGRLVRDGTFREDLYYRLNVVPLPVPPLRERREDIVALARLFIARLAPDEASPPELGADAISALERHAWPGNVRELRNVIERAMAYAPVPPILDGGHLRIGRS